MPLAVTVVLVVTAVTAVFAVAGYLIDRSAEHGDLDEHQPKEGDKA